MFNLPNLGLGVLIEGMSATANTLATTMQTMAMCMCMCVHPSVGVRAAMDL